MINNLPSNLFGLALLIFAAAIWERFDDRAGDLNKKVDLFYRSALILLATCINALLNMCSCEIAQRCGNIRHAVTFLLLSFNLGVASFFLIFDYWINYTLLKNGAIELPIGSRETWFTYLRKGGFDAWRPWARLKPRTRFLIKAGYFLLSLIIYVVWKW